MIVSEIHGANWQGENFSHKLGAFTAIVGENMAGKSTLKNAIQVALLGYSPAIGNKSNLTFGFAGDRSTGAQGVKLRAVLSDGRVIAREWKKSGDRISTGVTGEIKFPPVLLDVETEFLGLSGPKRVDMVFQRIDLGDSFSLEHVMQRLREAIFGSGLQDESLLGPDVENLLHEITEDAEALDAERLEFRWTRQQWLDKLSEHIKAKADSAKATVESMAGTVQGTAALLSQEGLQAPFDRNLIKEAKQKLADLQVKQGRYNLALEQADARTSKIRALEKMLEEKNRDALKRELQELDDKIKGIQERHHDPDRTLKLSKEHSLINQRWMEAHGKVKACESAISDLKQEGKSTTCPRCKCKSAGWTKIKATIKKEIKALETKMETLSSEREMASSELKQAEKRLEFARQQDSEFVVSANQLRTLTVTRNEKAKEIISLTNAEDELQKLKTELKPDLATSFERDIFTLQTQIENLEKQERESIRRMSDEQRQGEARKKHSEAAAQWAISKLALKALAEMKKEVMAKSFGGFLAKVERFTKGFFDGPLEFRDGEIGYFRGAQWVGLDFFSGTQKMLTFIGLSVALAQQSPLKIIFIDEWIRDSKTRLKVNQRLTQMIEENVIDQAVVIDVDESGYSAIGASVIKV